MQRFATASVLALMAAAGQVQAEVTPQQVWDDFEAYMTGFGYQVSAREVMEGDTLTIGDLTMVVPVPEEEGTVTVTMSEMTLADTGDGAVRITYPEQMPMTVTIAEGDDTAAELVFDLTQSDFDMVVSGDPGDMLYTFSATSVGLKLAEIMAEGEQIPSELFDVTFDMGPMEGTQHTLIEDGLRKITQDVTLGDLAYSLMFDDPESDDSGTMSGRFTGLASSGTTEIPEDADFADPTALFTAGLMMDVVMSHTGGENQFKVTERAGTTEGAFSSTGGELGVAMNADSLTYAVSASGQTVAVAGPELPLPINAELGELGFSVTMPLSESDTPKPAAISILLGEFTMSDMLWNIFDPQQALPRDPATVAINLDAEVTPKVSLLDPEAMEEMGESGMMPGELNSLKLTDLVVDAAGGKITGSGDFTFDNTDLATFDGLPRPMGEVNLDISGANGLIDKLIAMGLMQEQDAMGARMMLGMFTVPGAEPDTASSKIEINEQGHVLANGQRIK